MRPYDDLLIDALLDRGFTTEEAQRLIALQDRVEHERRHSSQAGAHPSESQPGKDRPDYDDPRAR
ncbi:MAG TPA: hypothetical protein VGR57_05235 [Ktedonobacterales bacterium]|nr:hypothetical protein [Ktedonobacterales bacterium]